METTILTLSIITFILLIASLLICIMLLVEETPMSIIPLLGSIFGILTLIFLTSYISDLKKEIKHYKINQTINNECISNKYKLDITYQKTDSGYIAKDTTYILIN